MKELSIEITIDELGVLEAETFGFKGNICEKELCDLLSSDFIIEQIERKDDYYKPVDETIIISEKTKVKKNYEF